MEGGKFMKGESMSLARQIDMVFRQIQDELSQLSSGTVFIQIRNNVVGKFGVRHLPLQGTDGKMEVHKKGLSDSQLRSFRQMALDALKFKCGWTHGEMIFDFTTKQNLLCASVQFESNYNMASLMPGLHPNPRNAPDHNAFI
jgi:hypothetical protein